MTIIDIYSGFLGAGKTTLIKKMIQEAYCGQQLVLIENEFGEIGIDGGFLQDAGINITEMNSGCICCSLVGDFGKALTEVIERYHPDRIVIEPSGVGKLSDVIAAVEKVTGEDVVLGNTVAVADAGKVKVYMKNFGEFYNNQIETASTIILSRTDAIAQAKLDAAVALLREHNANAALITTPWKSSPTRSSTTARRTFAAGAFHCSAVLVLLKGILRGFFRPSVTILTIVRIRLNSGCAFRLLLPETCSSIATPLRSTRAPLKYSQTPCLSREGSETLDR